MLNWMYRQSTDSYYAEIPCELDVPVILELDLSHSHPGQKWQLAAKTKTDPEMNFKIRVTVPADPENTDIDDVKNRAAHAMNMTMGRAAVMLKKAMSEIANDSVQPYARQTHNGQEPLDGIQSRGKDLRPRRPNHNCRKLARI